MMSEIGVIFHWGIYAVPAYFETTSKNYEGNGSEWYQKRLEDKATWMPVAGHQQTKNYHQKNYGSDPYSQFAKQFTAKDWNPDQWMQLCKSIGATYVILTAKHHDGFCLWSTTTTQFNACVNGPNKDLLHEFAQSARKHQLKFGIYYSWMEFNHSCTINYMKTIAVPQVRELIKYQPDIFWFHGDWECKTQSACSIIDDLCQEIKTVLPNVEINDRLGSNKVRKQAYMDPSYLGYATYRNYADRTLPVQRPNVSWESIHTIGKSWGYNQAQTPDQYKTGQQLFDLHKQIKALNGKLLLNLGPTAHGQLDPYEVQSLTDFGVLLKQGQKIKIPLKLKAI